MEIGPPRASGIPMQHEHCRAAAALDHVHLEPGDGNLRSCFGLADAHHRLVVPPFVLLAGHRLRPCYCSRNLAQRGTSMQGKALTQC